MLRYIHKTVYFNFRSLPFKQAVKLPIWLYRPNILSCKGKIEFGGGKIKPGMVRLGFNAVSIYPQNGIMIENKGTISFQGRCYIGNNSYISVGSSGYVSFGEDFAATAAFRLASYDRIEFGNQVSVGWDCLFMDTDFHRLTREDGKRIKAYGNILIGNNVWFGNNCIVLKNTVVPNFTTMAAGTMLNSRCVVPEKTVIGNHLEVFALKQGVWRNFDDDNIIYGE